MTYSLSTAAIRRLLARTVLAAVLAMTGGAAPAADGAEAVTYSIGAKEVVRTLYPDQSWLPEKYKKHYPDLAGTIRHYTLQSLKRDGVEGAQVRVAFVRQGDAEHVQVSIKPVNAVTRRYAEVHPRFLDKEHAQVALAAVRACAASKPPATCWEPHGAQATPWAFYLPLGMALANQKAIMFMNYPPAVALEARDYLDNFTIHRWNQVLERAGVAGRDSFDVILDARPIAAAGSGQDALLPDPITWYRGAAYLTPMLQLLTEPVDSASGSTRPVAVFGASPRRTWARIVGKAELDVLDVGETVLSGQEKKTRWIVTNHPDVTTYNCCAQDGSDACRSKSDGKFSQRLLADEKIDFVAACWLQRTTSDPSLSAQDAKDQCVSTWMDKPSPAHQQALCIQAKLDNQNKAAACPTVEKARQYCAAHNANACATLDCRYDE